MTDINERKILYRATPPVFWNHPFLVIIYIALSVVAIGIPLLIWLNVVSKRRVLEIDSEEIHYSEGVFRKIIIDVPLDAVRTVKVRQGFIQRLVNMGNLEIYTSGDLPELTLNGYPNPHDIREILK